MSKRTEAIYKDFMQSSDLRLAEYLGQPIHWYDPGVHCYSWIDIEFNGNYGLPRPDFSRCKWQPRYVPAPPVAEESPQIKEFREMSKHWINREQVAVIELMKRHEKGAK